MLIIRNLTQGQFGVNELKLEPKRRYAVFDTEKQQIVKELMGSTILNHLREDKRFKRRFRYSNFNGSFTSPYFKLWSNDSIVKQQEEKFVSISSKSFKASGNFTDFVLGIVYFAKLDTWYFRVGDWCYEIGLLDAQGNELRGITDITSGNVCYLRIADHAFIWGRGNESSHVINIYEFIVLQVRNILFDRVNNSVKFSLRTAIVANGSIRAEYDRLDFSIDTLTGIMSRTSNGNKVSKVFIEGTSLTTIAKNLVFQ